MGLAANKAQSQQRPERETGWAHLDALPGLDPAFVGQVRLMWQRTNEGVMRTTPSTRGTIHDLTTESKIRWSLRWTDLVGLQAQCGVGCE
jgi:hypothetical protein